MGLSNVGRKEHRPACFGKADIQVAAESRVLCTEFKAAHMCFRPVAPPTESKSAQQLNVRYQHCVNSKL